MLVLLGGSNKAEVRGLSGITTLQCRDLMRNVRALFHPVIANYREREYCLFATKQSKQIPLRDSRMQSLLWAALFLMVAMDEIWIHKQSVKKTKKSCFI